MIESEFMQVTVLTKAQLHTMLKGQSLDTTMAFRREMQVALARYAKGKGATPDIIQRNALSIIQQVESWARQAFYTKRIPEILRQEGSLIYRGKKAAKWMVKKEWEEYAARSAY